MRRLPAALTIMATVVLLRLALWHGVGLNRDSLNYLEVAWRYPASGQLLAVDYTSGLPYRFVAQPPLLPLVLHGLAVSGDCWQSAGRTFNLLLLAGTLTAVSGLLQQLRLPSLTITAALVWLACSVDVLQTFAILSTEPLCFFLIFSAMFFMVEFIRHPERWYLLVLAWGGSVGAVLTRWAALPLLAAIAGGIYWLPDNHRWRQWWFAAGILCTALLPFIGCWDWQFGALSGAAPSSWQVPSLGVMTVALGVVSKWLLPAELPIVVRVMVCLIAGALMLGWYRRRGIMPGHPVIGISMLFVVSYGAFLGYCVITGRAYWLDHRILLPIYLCVVIWLAALLAHWRNEFSRWAVVLGGLLLVVSYCRAALWVTAIARDGIGYGVWLPQEEQMRNALLLLPHDYFIASNAPEAVYYLARRPARDMPRLGADVAAYYPQQWDELFRAAQGKPIYLVYFSPVVWRSYYPVHELLEQQLPVAPVLATNSSWLYRLPNPLAVP